MGSSGRSAAFPRMARGAHGDRVGVSESQRALADPRYVGVERLSLGGAARVPELAMDGSETECQRLGLARIPGPDRGALRWPVLHRCRVHRGADHSRRHLGCWHLACCRISASAPPFLAGFMGRQRRARGGQPMELALVPRLSLPGSAPRHRVVEQSQHLWAAGRLPDRCLFGLVVPARPGQTGHRRPPSE